MYNDYSRNVLKSYQINMGMPYQVKIRQKEAVPSDNRIEEKAVPVEEKPSADEILENARKEAEKIINEARIKAESILNSASAAVAARVKEAEEKAKEEGYIHGEALARKHYQSLINEAEELKQKAREIHDNTIAGLEAEIVDLIIQISRKVIGTELTQNREVILGLIRNALSAASLADRVLIHVSDEDYDFVAENKDRVTEGIKGIRGFEIVRDNSLKKGECLVDTGFGTVDSSIDIQLRTMEKTLRELLGETDTEESVPTEEKM